MATELRCDGTLYGVISDDQLTIEVKCKRRKCGSAPGIIVLHTLSLETGKELQTRRFADPAHTKKV